jgi:hypothetical protein
MSQQETILRDAFAAALAVAETIFNDLGEGREYFDDDFGPKNKQDKNGSKMSM